MATSSRLIVLASTLAALRFTLALLVVPAWQNPDEPQHMLVVRSLATRATDARVVEREIVRSMYEHEWWERYRVASPAAIPETFADGPDKVAGHFGKPEGPGLYYHMAAALLRTAGATDLVSQLFGVRVLSAVCGVLTVVVALVTGRLLMGAAFGTLVGGLLALHPQFALVATSATPDAFINLCGAILFLGAVQAIRGHRPLMWMTVALVAAVSAVLARRLGLPLLAMAGLTSAFVLGRFALRGWRAALVVAGLLGGAVLGMAFLAWVFGGTVASVYSAALPLLTKWAPEAAAGPFLTGLFHSAWLAAGWLTLPAPSAWIAAVLAGVVVCGFSALPRVWQLQGQTRSAAVTLPIAFVLVQACAIYWGYYRNGLGAQGRYLFPVIVPFMVLLSHGAYSNWMPRVAGAPVVLLVLAWLFDASAWASVVVPGFLD